MVDRIIKVDKSHHDSLSPGGLNVIEASMQVTQVPRSISQSLLQRHPQLTNFSERKTSEAILCLSTSEHIYLEQELDPN